MIFVKVESSLVVMQPLLLLQEVIYNKENGLMVARFRANSLKRYS